MCINLQVYYTDILTQTDFLTVPSSVNTVIVIAWLFAFMCLHKSVWLYIKCLIVTLLTLGRVLRSIVPLRTSNLKCVTVDTILLYCKTSQSPLSLQRHTLFRRFGQISLQVSSLLTNVNPENIRQAARANG